MCRRKAMSHDRFQGKWRPASRNWIILLTLQALRVPRRPPRRSSDVKPIWKCPWLGQIQIEKSPVGSVTDELPGARNLPGAFGKMWSIVICCLPLPRPLSRSRERGAGNTLPRPLSADGAEKLPASGRKAMRHSDSLAVFFLSRWRERTPFFSPCPGSESGRRSSPPCCGGGLLLPSPARGRGAGGEGAPRPKSGHFQLDWSVHH